ncbi:restriction endonuclease subunit S [Nocardia sp. 348MFTsu5.1]|uniref:restriction endonuclease subunit S n=1 Tax=Nocardia sp. 348MFTsu5.1 TaxID=1172185 RepID=UPI0003827ADC|nr:restriction endonuclease subunit S [Nocardia sp. 348MFTsu5.1]
MTDERPFGDLYLVPSRNGVSVPKGDRSNGTQMVNMGELFAFSRIGDADMARVPLSASELSRSLLEPGDLLFARRSLQLSGAGRCSLVVVASEPRTFESSLIRVRLDPSRVSPQFYYYYFASKPGRARMETIVEQAVVAGIRASDLSRLPVPCPPLPEQQAIAATLGALDDKIESNRRRVQLAQDLLRTTYRSWFVEHEPWAGVAPVDWTMGSLRDLIAVVRCSTKSGAEKDRPYIPIDVIPMNALGLEGVRPHEEAKSSLFLFEKNDILLGAMRVYFHRVALAPFPGITRNTTFVLRPQLPEYLPFCLLVCDDDATIAYAEATSKGSTMPYAVWDGGLAEMPILVPPIEVASEFGERTWPLLELIRDQMFETERLVAVRDALLPQLLSRRIRVPVDEAVS